MKTLLLTFLLILPVSSFAQNYYDAYEARRYNSQRDISDQIINSKQNHMPDYMKDQMKQMQREDEFRSNMLRYETIYGNTNRDR